MEPAAKNDAVPALRVVVADDHALVRGGLAMLLRMIDESVEIIEANDYQQTLEHLSREDSIDLMLLDLLMPGMDGATGIKHICENWPDVPIIVVSMREDLRAIREAISSGAAGYIPKTSSPNVTIGAIKFVLSGGAYVPPDVLSMTAPDAESHAERLASVEAAGAGPSPLPFNLTQRQKEVLDLMAEGKSNKAIAKELGLTAGTVKMHTSRIFRNMNVENRTEAVAHYSKYKAAQ